MDEVTIQKIAAEVARHLPSYTWMLLLVQVVILGAAAAVGAFFGEYLKMRGKNLATKRTSKVYRTSCVPTPNWLRP
jgi:hypothetical protein